MKLMSFEADGRRRFGVVQNDSVVDLSDADTSELAVFLARNDWHKRAQIAEGARFPLSSVQFLPVITNREAKIIALGWAYADHRAETGRAPDTFPSFFMKHVDSLVGHKQLLEHPGISDAFDFEGEFAIVIGKIAHRISEEEAFDHVAGYTILMDGSVRDWQKHSVTSGKNFDRSSSCGPWMVTLDEMRDPQALNLTTTLNGTVMQQANTSSLLWTIPYLISYCAAFTTLRPGDLISTGTPGGVGHKRNPPVFMKRGDKIEISIDGIGSLANTVG